MNYIPSKGKFGYGTISCVKITQRYLTMNNFVQICLTVFTILGFSLTAYKLPQYGLISNFIAQIFWLYSSYRAWRDAKQIGIFITTIFITFIVLWGITNYWVL